MVHLANMASVAVARLVIRARETSRLQLQARLAQRQRLESLGLLAGGVAHDFNNLLLVIRVSLGFIGEGPLTDVQRQDLAAAVNAERSATALIKKLLMLGRQDAPAFENADVNQMVRDSLRLLERVLPANIQTHFVAGAGLPRLRVDLRQLEQVLMNLALNARDAMPNGGRLTIETQQVVINGEYRRAHPWANPGRYVLLTIADTGYGMPPEVVERVFEPFFTTKPMGEGTGLGLAVSWGIVHRHGGMIHCYSEVEVGTSFKIYLPAGEQAATEVGTKIAGPVPRGTARVLVADDQGQVLAVMMRVLSKAGYRVTGVSNGADAVTAAEKDAFDLHILDSVMPVMSGRDACERIRAARPDARFLFTSGYGGDVLPSSFLETAWRCSTAVSKPSSGETIVRCPPVTRSNSRPRASKCSPRGMGTQRPSKLRSKRHRSRIPNTRSLLGSMVVSSAFAFPKRVVFWRSLGRRDRWACSD